MNNVKPFGPRINPQPQQIQVDISNATPKVCECGSRFFIPAVQCFTVSALMSPTGRELLAQQTVLVCMECKAPVALTQGGEDVEKAN